MHYDFRIILKMGSVFSVACFKKISVLAFIFILFENILELLKPLYTYSNWSERINNDVKVCKKKRMESESRDYPYLSFVINRLK